LKKNNIPSNFSKESLIEISELLRKVQVCVIFTNGDITQINDLLVKFKITKDGRDGDISPIEVIIPAGPTGMDSSQIDYFQNLKIQTKVVRTQLEIIAPTKILTPGQKMTLSEVNLMKKFGIKPFTFSIKVLVISMNGKLYSPDILKINADHIKERVLKGIKNIASFGLATNISNKASAPHQIANTFLSVAGLSSASGVNFKSLSAGVSSGAPSGKAEKTDKKEPEKKDDKKGGDKGGKDDKKGGDKGGKDDKKGGDKGGKKEKEEKPVEEEFIDIFG